ncbi:protein NETWORKED 2A-like [Abrus precatorius]|uniref:Protein NETWORKED 2A-like n=1 Tax=Abrus precatorius TaxID=3816 RepID=A0A8B8LK45_ABRPR|nr:protein NETWORKED 2A-like [Abrus precatorius]
MCLIVKQDKMLRRAATNAYSWWWASHIRTKQSKWLEQSLQDMEENVAETLKIIHDDGESFSQRAEMYFRKRPELVGFVEEAFRAYRALAERYDHLSKELQSANRTIATVFPEQVHYRIDEDDDDEVSFLGTNSPSQDPNNQTPKPVIPKVPSIPKKDFRSKSMVLARKGPLRRIASSVKSTPTTPSSGLSKAEALAEVDKLQKEILALQTEKEFFRSLYENSYKKYWEIEDQITEMHKRVCSLQDEFDISTVIEENDAQALMAAKAINSCKVAVAKLQEIQAQSSEEAKAAYEMVKEAHETFETLRDQFISKHSSQQDQGTEPKGLEEEMASLEEEMHGNDVGLLQDMIKENLEEDSGNSLTMTEIAEKIDEFVSKIVTLETAVSSQTGLVKRLRTETDEFQKNILSLEEDKEKLIENSEETKEKLKELEKELRRVQIIDQSIKRQISSLQTRFNDSGKLERLSGKLNNVKLDEGENFLLNGNRSEPDGKLKEETEKPGDNLPTDDLAITNDVETTKEEKEEYAANLSDIRNEDDESNLKGNIDIRTEGIPALKMQDNSDLSEARSNLHTESLDQVTGEEEDQPSRRQMFVSGLDDPEKISLEENTSISKNCNDEKVKLNDVEKKNLDSISELTLQVRELKDVVATKDKEIDLLQQKLTSSETNWGESPCTTLTDYKYAPQEVIISEGTNMQDTENPSSNTDASVVSTSYAEQHQVVVNTTNIDMTRTILVKVKGNQVDTKPSLSTLEKKYRSDIDDLLEENLQFWMRFSTSVHQIQKFQNSIQDLKAELRKIKDTMSREKLNSIKSEIKPIFRHLKEIRTELLLWLEHNQVLQEELQGRHPSLCTLQDEIARAANPDSASSKAELSGYQAAKFQGEVLNMKQENNKVSGELQVGLNFMKGLKNDIEKMLEELSQEIGVNNNGYGHDQTKQSSSRSKLPLKSFLFGIKLKKQRQSVFSCVNPTLQKQNSDLTAANDAPI